MASLPSRYEIRTLGPEHAEWARAIVMHSTCFASPVWSKMQVYAEGKTALCYRLFRATVYLMDHQVRSGLSLGIFDREYEFRRPESAASEGMLHWNLDDDTADEATLRDQMDFPLVSVALAYDSFFALDAARVAPVLEVLPALAVRNRTLEARDTRGPTSIQTWQATGPGQVIFRNGTATKAGEGGHGFMKALAHAMMRKAAADGFRGIQILCLHDAVNAVWTHPPAPFRADIVARFNCATDDDEEVRRAFEGSDQEITKVYVTLK